MQSVISQFPSKRDKLLIENLAFYDPIDLGNLKDIVKLDSWCKGFTSFLNTNTSINLSFELKPSKDMSDDNTHSILITKKVNGVSSPQEPLNKHFFSSDSYNDLIGLKLYNYSTSLLSFSSDNSTDDSSDLSLRECFDKLISLSKKSITLQRYKGLGEMNPPQLEETTMNVKSRTLLKVLPLEDLNPVVVELMGDDVEPRREFIKQKYSSVKNLDI